jgi:hypothetical protein
LKEIIFFLVTNKYFKSIMGENNLNSCKIFIGMSHTHDVLNGLHDQQDN